MLMESSREDENAVESETTLVWQVTVAAVWKSVVCGVHDAYYWEFVEGGHSWVLLFTLHAAPLCSLTLAFALELLLSPSSSCFCPRALADALAGFVAFDQFKALLQDSEGNISGPRTVIAGFGAGVTESLLAVTPFESIKTTLYVLIFKI
jgi:hypothetical protein